MKISLGSVTLMKPGRAHFMMKLGCHMSFTPGLRMNVTFCTTAHVLDLLMLRK